MAYTAYLKHLLMVGTGHDTSSGITSCVLCITSCVVIFLVICCARCFQVTKREEESRFTIGERLCNPYNDVIQAPLQPLMDNLEASTYEVNIV